MSRCLVWFRQDLRLSDNPALKAAIQSKKPVIALYILDEESKWKPGAASRWWLHHSLLSLKRSLKDLGIPLILAKGSVFEEIARIVKQEDVESVFCNHCYGKEEKKIQKALSKLNVAVSAFHGNVLVDPQKIGNKQGKPYQVFTPFYKTLLKETFDLEGKLPSYALKARLNSKHLQIDDLGLLPDKNWDEGFYCIWNVGEKAALDNLKKFTKKSLVHYFRDRDFPFLDGTSKMSPYLHFGEISPKRVWQIVSAESSAHSEAFLRQIAWREFAHHLLYHFPDTESLPLNPLFASFEWKKSATLLKKWKEGKTGYPLIDAAMRQLWQEGWMHNRLRMVVGSFLVKDLLISWTEGAKWFWDTLVDADLANNTFGWQWIGGCGADAAPYFRVFNPVLQGEKFDPEGEFVKRYVPELKDLPPKWIHRPWEAPKDVLEKAGVTLGKEYPEPVVDHKKAQKEALSLYNKLRKKK